MKLSLLTRRSVWWPTWQGWLVLVFGMGLPLVWWLTCGEAFLSVTERQPADILVVEGWIGRDGVRSACEEFESGGYRYLMAAGGYTSGGWMGDGWSYAEIAKEELLRLHVPREKLLVARARKSETQRTYESAVAAKEALREHGIQPTAVNVLTRGLHSRRSRLVFSKVFGSSTPIGVIAWNPKGFPGERWWRSSEQAKEFITETAGYLFELLAGSGRWLHRPHEVSDEAESGGSPSRWRSHTGSIESSQRGHIRSIGTGACRGGRSLPRRVPA